MISALKTDENRLPRDEMCYLEGRIETVHAKTFSFVAFEASVVAFAGRRGAFLLLVGYTGPVVGFTGAARARRRPQRPARRAHAHVARVTRRVRRRYLPFCFILKKANKRKIIRISIRWCVTFD